MVSTSLARLLLRLSNEIVWIASVVVAKQSSTTNRGEDHRASYGWYSYAPRVHVVRGLPSLSTSYGAPTLSPLGVLAVR
jgi:hypothetical protein